MWEGGQKANTTAEMGKTSQFGCAFFGKKKKGYPGVVVRLIRRTMRVGRHVVTVAVASLLSSRVLAVTVVVEVDEHVVTL